MTTIELLTFLAWCAGVVTMLLFVVPFFVFECVKMGTYGYLTAHALWAKRKPQELDNAKRP